MEREPTHVTFKITIGFSAEVIPSCNRNYEIVRPCNYFGCSVKFPGSKLRKIDFTLYDTFFRVFSENDVTTGKLLVDKATNLRWVVWTYTHTVPLNNALLEVLMSDDLVVKMTSEKDRIGTKARFDRHRPSSPINAVDSLHHLPSNWLSDYCGFSTSAEPIESAGIGTSHQGKLFVRVNKSTLPTFSKISECTRLAAETASSAMASHDAVECAKKPPVRAGVHGGGNSTTNTVLRMSPRLLFSGHKSITSSMQAPMASIGRLVLAIHVEKPLLSSRLVRELQPLEIVVRKAVNLPDRPISFNELTRKCQGPFVKYRFMDAYEYKGKQSRHGEMVLFDDANVLLLGKISREELFRYFTFGKLVIEVHDRDVITKEVNEEVHLFGMKNGDDAFGDARKNIGNRYQELPLASPFGVAVFQLDSLMKGITRLKACKPIVCSTLDLPFNQLAVLPGDYSTYDSTLKVDFRLLLPLTTGSDLSLSKSLHVNMYNRAVFIGNADVISTLSENFTAAPPSTVDGRAEPEPPMMLSARVLDPSGGPCFVFLEWRSGLDLNIDQYHLDGRVLYNPSILFNSANLTGCVPPFNRVTLIKPFQKLYPLGLLAKTTKHSPATRFVLKLWSLQYTFEMEMVIREDLFPTTEECLSLWETFDDHRSTTSFRMGDSTPPVVQTTGSEPDLKKMTAYDVIIPPFKETPIDYAHNNMQHLRLTIKGNPLKTPLTVIDGGIEADVQPVRDLPLLLDRGDHRSRTNALKRFSVYCNNQLSLGEVHPARRDELRAPWVENELHGNTLQPTLDRDVFPWRARREDFHVAAKPESSFCMVFPCRTLRLEPPNNIAHLNYTAASFRTYRRSCWRENGARTADQVTKTEDILHDSPVKLSLTRFVPFDRQQKHIDMLPGDGHPYELRKAFVPGDGHNSLSVTNNVIPL